ncbi:hypothetical protein Dda_8613 [Drechslerella dactyloides]|uniref:Uncharacterized protein n=1 Tax=Drechslerella dactyloides TaxID=74499 RepID=A0AAD6IQX3_DREDA|nr:hypothetical protein Dda_8613 [Drechslerella dactyloides]
MFVEVTKALVEIFLSEVGTYAAAGACAAMAMNYYVYTLQRLYKAIRSTLRNAWDTAIMASQDPWSGFLEL